MHNGNVTTRQFTPFNLYRLTVTDFRTLGALMLTPLESGPHLYVHFVTHNIASFESFQHYNCRKDEVC